MVYLFEDYREFMKSKIKSLPLKGRGQVEKIARHLNVHQSLVSQILHGSKSLSEEQALLVAEYFEMSEPETEYFIALVQFSKATNQKLQSIHRRNILRLKQTSLSRESSEKSSTVQTPLSEEDRRIFYSTWYYSAVRLLTSITRFQSVGAIANYLGLPQEKTRDILKFLVAIGLCDEVPDGKFIMKVKRTQVNQDSLLLLNQHHLNWRLKAIESIQSQVKPQFSHTSPMTLSVTDAKRVQEILMHAIYSQIESILDPSPAEQMYCLNVDWFAV